jgi:hypothetical protein
VALDVGTWSARNDTDADGDPLQAQLSPNPAVGTLELAGTAVSLHATGRLFGGVTSPTARRWRAASRRLRDDMVQ